MASAFKTVHFGDPVERRVDARVPLARTGTLRLPGEPASREIRITDLNRDGCRIESALPLTIDQVVAIGIPGVGQHDAKITWAAERDYGCHFDRALPPGSVTAAMTDNVLDMGLASGGFRAPSTYKWQSRKRLVLLVGLSLVGWTLIALAVGRLLA